MRMHEPRSTAVTAAGEQCLLLDEGSLRHLHPVGSARVAPATTHRPQGHHRDPQVFTRPASTRSTSPQGSLVGTVRDQWSMDEHKGDLRVARSLPDSSGQTNANGVAVLRQDGKTLKQIGSIDDLGINEEIQSVRWLDDLAIVVTFRQVDPLYTIDLSDPAAPKKLGELKIPGFSAYLHPIGQDQLIGIGVDADTQGRMLGAQLATFDLSDLGCSQANTTRPLRRRAATLMATYDPKAFTWLPDVSSCDHDLVWRRSTAKANRLLIVDSGR
ncbi:MAG: beta-propeller domain-containing protein [Marmoricola sp.]